MPARGTPLERLGFLTIGTFDPADPRAGHEATLRMIELGEQLGFDSAWVRHRHLQHGISSPVAFLAAASQRTSRIELGTAVTPLAWETHCAWRRPGHRRRPVGRPAEPRRERRPADALGRRPGVALPGHR